MSCDRKECLNIGKSICYRCMDYSEYKILEKKKPMKKVNYNKSSNRMGSTFEMNNHIQNEQILKDAVQSNMTPNSGAGKVKGDEQIRGLINIMEELKTQEVTRARGTAQFTVKKEWFDKLNHEARCENMEFWYLKFAFKDNDINSYTIIDTEQMMSMVATIAHDRAIAKSAESRINIANKKSLLKEAESVKLFAENEYLKSILDDKQIIY